MNSSGDAKARWTIEKAALAISAIASVLIVIGVFLFGSSEQKSDPEPGATESAATEPSAQEVAEQSGPRWRTRKGWHVKCAAVDQGRLCHSYFQIVDESQNQRVFSLAVHNPKTDEDPYARFQLPLGLYLPAGANLQIDDEEAVTIPVRTCLPRGCFALWTLEPDTLEALKAGQNMQVNVETINRRPLTIRFPLERFADAYARQLEETTVPPTDVIVEDVDTQGGR